MTAFDLGTVKRAAYRFLDRFSADIRTEDAEVVCDVTFAHGVSAQAAQEIIADFRKEVLDQDLRRVVAAETAVYRNAILALAFAPSKLQGDE